MSGAAPHALALARRRRAFLSGDAASVEGRPALTLRDEDREGVASALADVILARALADEASEAEAATS